MRRFKRTSPSVQAVHILVNELSLFLRQPLSDSSDDVIQSKSRKKCTQTNILLWEELIYFIFKNNFDLLLLAPQSKGYGPSIPPILFGTPSHFLASKK